MIKKSKLIIFIICLFFLLSACSYKEFEDSMKEKLNKPEEEEYINPAKLPDKPADTENENTPESDEKSLYTIGDTITFTSVSDESYQYTLNQVNINDNINDLDLSKKDFSNTSFIDGNGDIDKEHLLLTVDVTIKNIDNEGFGENRDDDNVPQLFIEGMLGFKSGIVDPQGPFSLESAYFSEHSKENKEKDYNIFYLEKGKELDATVGWFVPADQLEEEPLYYVIGSEGSSEFYEYFELTFD